MPGPTISWVQQSTILKATDRAQEPHVAFLTDLAKWLCKEQNKESEILLNLDTNEKWSEKSEIRIFTQTLGLVNLTHSFHLEHSHPNLTEVRKSTTIDFCLCTEKVRDIVTYAGSTPYDLESLGDHRGFIVDLDIQKLLKDNNTPDSRMVRKLTTRNPTAMDKYVTKVRSKFCQQNIYERATKLIRQVNCGDTDMASIMTQYERLEKDIHGIRWKAERHYRTTPTGSYEWSPKLANAIKKINYWRQRLHQDKETPVIRKLGADINIQYTPLSKQTIHQMINDSKKNLSSIQQDARRIRKDHLIKLADNYSKENNVTQQTAINELLEQEDIRQTFKTVKTNLKPMQRPNLKALWVAVLQV